MSEHDEQLLGRFRDGELSARARRRLATELEGDPERAQELKRLEQLGVGLRDTQAGIPPLQTDFLIARLRPAMAEIDAETRRERPSRRLAEWLGAALRPGPVGLAAAVAAALVLSVLPGGPSVPTGLLEGSVPAVVQPAPAPAMEEAPGSPDAAVAEALDLSAPASIYDLSSEDTPVMVFEGEDGSTVIWLLQNDEISRAGSGGWA